MTENPIGPGLIRKGMALLGLAFAVSACQGGIDDVFPKAERPIPPKLVQKMKAYGMTPSSPIMMRIFKQDNVLEVWKQADNGRFALLETYDICKWSGKLGPKFKEGDRQAPEGFYDVAVHQLNPRSDYHLSFNIGFPNTYDRAHGRTGTHLMVHGACSSAGCYSMTDEQVEEIYALARDALKGGQKSFQVQAFPFRMTASNLAQHVTSEHFDFWKTLKEGYDQFELTSYPPKVDVCEKRYVFNREPVDEAKFSAREACPQVTMPERLLSAYSKKRAEEQTAFEKALRRHKLRNAKNDPGLAALDPASVSIAAPGSEVLPPPTPRPEPVETEPAIASAEPGKEEPATTAPSPATAGAVANESDPRETIAAITASDAVPQAGESTGNGESGDGISAGEEVIGIVKVRAIPVPQPAPAR